MTYMNNVWIGKGQEEPHFWREQIELRRMNTRWEQYVPIDIWPHNIGWGQIRLKLFHHPHHHLHHPCHHHLHPYIADIRHDHHDLRWCTFCNRCTFCKENAKFWHHILANYGYFVANLCAFWCTFTGWKTSMLYQIWQISGMMDCCICPHIW